MDNAAISDMFASVGPVTIKRMFGGKGVYCDGKIVAVEVDGEILLKADAHSAPLFAEAGARQWTYKGKKQGKPVAMPYWSIPDSALDDPDEMAVWARRAYEAGLRGGRK
jgi:DNA transformation protein and related proteins